MIILEEGMWSGYSCAERTFSIFGLCFVVAAGFFLLAPTVNYLTARYSNRLDSVEETFNFGDPLILWSFVGMACVVGLFAGVLFSASPNLTAKLTDETRLVEKGCIRLKPYEDVIDIAEAEITYVQSNGKHASHYLVFEQGQTRIGIEIVDTARLDVLARIAPEPMRDYIRYIIRLGRPVPRPLQSLRREI